MDTFSDVAESNKNGFIESNEFSQYVQRIIQMIAKHKYYRDQILLIDKCGSDLKFKNISRE